jgi:hypothetical protein
MVGYVTAMVYGAAQLSLWTPAQTSETVFWFFGTGIVLLFNYDKAVQDSSFVRYVFKRALGVALLVEFVVNLYPFPLIVELVLVPVLAFLGAMLAMAEHRGEKTVKRFLEAVLGIIGISFLLNALLHVVGDPGDFVAEENLQDILVPILFTIGLIPFLYVFALYATYESLFSRVGIFIKDKEVARHAKWLAIRYAGPRMSILRRFSTAYPRELYRGLKNDEVDRIAKHIAEGSA